MAIFGSSNLSDSGDLLIFNKVSHKTLLMFEKAPSATFPHG